MNFLIELIQIAIGTRDLLTKELSCDEWYAVYDEAWKQAVAGVVYHGVLILGERGVYPPKDLLLRWIGQCEFLIKQRNVEMDEYCVELLSRLKYAGLHPTILKGQGVAKLYGDNLSSLRQPGDIDIYVSDGIGKSLQIAKSQGGRDINWDYKHLHLKIWDDVEIELHYHVELLFDVFKNRKLQRWFVENGTMLFEKQGNLVAPTLEMNVFYILLHIYRHFFTEGIGLRQLMDYFFVLRKVYVEEVKVNDSVNAVNKFGMERFAKGLMWVMNEVFAMPKEWMFWDLDAKEGKFILEQVVSGGNFGHYSDKKYRFNGSLKYVESLLCHSLHLLWRYPSEALWTPIWIVWHKCWKEVKKRQLA